MTDRQLKLNKYINFNKLNYVYRLDLPETYDSGKPTILIVDDFESILILFAKLMKRMNLEEHFNIVYSGHGDAAVKVLNELYVNEDFSVDIIIADITFAGIHDTNIPAYSLSGIKLVGILKDINPSLLYRFITGHIISRRTTPLFFKEYAEYSNENLLNYINYKDVPITTNKPLVNAILKDTIYEKYIQTDM